MGNLVAHITIGCGRRVQDVDAGVVVRSAEVEHLANPGARPVCVLELRTEVRHLLGHKGSQHREVQVTVVDVMASVAAGNTHLLPFLCPLSPPSAIGRP